MNRIRKPAKHPVNPVILSALCPDLLGKETPENRDKERSGKAVVLALAQQRGAS